MYSNSSSVHLSGNGALMDPDFLRGTLAQTNATRSSVADSLGWWSGIGVFFGALMIAVGANFR